MNQRRLFWATATLAVVADQLTKHWVRATVPLYTSIPVVASFFDLTHVENPGGAFSLFADADSSWRRPFFVIVSVLAVVLLLSMLRQVGERQRGLTAALGAILGGAIGNLIDRVWFGVVTDFLDVYWGSWHWPAFNLADSCISLGITVLLFDSLMAGARGAHDEAHDQP